MKKWMENAGQKTAQQRAKELLSEMTLAEKAGQLAQRLYGFAVYERDENGKIRETEEFRREVEACGGLGTLYGLYRADPWSGRNYENGLPGKAAVSAYNHLQQYVIAHSRLGIPMLLCSECPHGHQALDGYVLPVNLASAASFAPGLLEEAASVCGRQMKEMGVDLALVSALDVLRDPRWGRSEECFGEDPYLAGCFAEAVTRGIQKEGVDMVAKHFCAQGETTGGINASAARIGERELHEIHLPPARKCCKAGVKGIMAAYNEIDGVFCHANSHLLNEILRTEFGFNGVVMADGTAIDRLDVMTGDNLKSAGLALSSGVDIGLWDQAFSRLAEAVEKGLISEERLDEAVLRVLTLKFERGLFETPYIGENGKRTSGCPKDDQMKKRMDVPKAEEGEAAGYSYEQFPQSERLAAESPVLLKNKGGVLPLKEGLRIALIGPLADDIYRQIGDYSPPIRKGRGCTLLQGLKEGAGTRSIRFSEGKEEKEVQELTGWCDVAVLALGSSSSRFAGADFDKNGAALKQDGAEMDCGEGVDASKLTLPWGQERLAALVFESRKPVVAVIIAGRPYAVTEIAERSEALLYSFYPGPMGGRALADLLYGKKSPSGRLPVSLPRRPGQLPVYYNYKRSYQAMRYFDEEDGPLFSFGEGMGYSTFRYTQIKARLSGEGILLSCRVENTGAAEDAAVLQCYRSLCSSKTVPRVRELKAFKKLWLKPGEAVNAEITIDREFFLVYDTNGKWKEEKGIYELLLMDSGVLIWKGEIVCI